VMGKLGRSSKIKEFIFIGLFTSLLLVAGYEFINGFGGEYGVSLSEDISEYNITNRLNNTMKSANKLVENQDTNLVNKVVLAFTGIYDMLKVLFDIPGILASLLNNLSGLIGVPDYLINTIFIGLSAIVTLIIAGAFLRWRLT